MRTLLHRICSKLSRIGFSLSWGKAFSRLGPHSFLHSPFRIDGPENIRMGEMTVLQRGGWLYCQGLDGQPARLQIGDRCQLGYNNHITAVRDVVIGNDVLTANNVYISDNVHGYEDVTVPVMNQPVRFKKAVAIGDGSWIGENVCIIGASVGRNAVIGANAVVLQDIPDYCVAVGAPARVIRRFDPVAKQWVSV